jgi:hypothetical protein
VSANPKTYDNTTAATLSGSAVLVGILGTDQVSLSGIAVGTFATRTAGPAKSVNLSGLSLAGADAANYSLSLPTLSANITPATLTVTGMAADNKVYDAGTAATIHTGVAVLVGVLGSDHVSLDATGALGTFDDANIGTAKTVAISGLVLAGTDAGNYSLIQPTLAANITPAGATASGITANDKIYDGTTAANLNTNGATLLGVLGTDQVTLVLTNSTGAFDSKTVGSAKTVTVSGLELVGPDAAKYTLAQPTTTATITAATLTVSGLSAQDKIYDSTQTASLAGTTQLVGIIGADQVSPDGTATGTFATRTAGSAKPVNVTGLTLIGDDAANYSLTQPVLSADITPASLTVTGLVADSKVYDDTTAATLAGTPVLVGVIGTDQVSLNSSDVAHLNAKVVGTFATRTAGAARTVTVSGLGLSGADAANYTLTEPVLSASIIPANLTITGLAVSSKVYDGTRAATLSGAPALVGVISPDQVTLSGAAIATFATQTAASAKPVNVTGLTLSGADAANYTLTQLVLSADIAPANLTINGLLASSKIYDGTTAAMLTGSPALAGIIGTDQVSLSGPASGTFASRTAESAKPVNLTGLSLTGADAGNYSLIVPVLSANIIPAAVTVTGITVDNKAYDGTTVATIHTGAALLVGALGTDTVSLDVTAALGAFDDSNVGTAKTVTVSGLALAGADASDYSLVQPILTANITAAGATVTGITAHDKVYDGTASATLNTNSAALAGVLSTDQVTLVLTNAAGTFDSKVVGSGKTVTVGGLALIGPDAAKYTLTQPITTAAITAANLTISGLSTQDRTYDGTSAATLGGTPELVGVIGTDQVSLSGTALGTFASRTVGSSKPVSVTGLTLTGSDAANYSLTEPVLSANISTANLTITGLTAGNKIYDGTTAGTLSGTPSLVGIIGADQVSLTGIATGTFANRNAGSAKPVSVTGLSLTGADAANYSLTEPALSANISTANLTVAGLTVDNKIYDGTIAATLSGTPALVGIIGADQVSLSGAAICTFANSTVASTKAVSVTGLSLSGTDAGNYSLTEPALSANITPANLTVIGITADNKTYDGSSTASIHVGAAALVGLLGSDNVTLNTAAALGTFADGNVGAAKMVAISGLALGGVDAGNYSLTQPTATANITPAGVTVVGITAHDKVYDGTASASLNTNGALLVGVLGIDQVTLTLTNATGAFDSKTVGNGKTVTVTGLQLVGPDAAKYTLTQPGTTAAITTATLTLSGLSAQNKVYDSTATATLTGTAKLVGIVGADQVNLNGTAVGAFATRTAGTAKSVNVTGLSLTGADSANYTLIEPVLSGDITSANLTITGLSASNKIYDGTTAATLSGTPTLAGIIGTDQVSLSGTAIGTFATRTAGSAKSVNVTGLTLSGADAANYNLTQPTLNANITQAALTVTGISADNKVYDGTTAATIHTGAAALAGVSGSDTVSLNRTAALGTFADAAAGTAKSVTVTGLLLTGADAGNYTLVQPTLTANITPALLTITADNQNRPYGLTNSPLTFTFTGFVNSETAAVLSGQPSLTTTATATSPAGTYAISASLGTLSAANYSFQFVNGTLTITPDAPLILGITRNTPSTVLISWTSVSNVTYRVQFASDLSSSTWTDLAPDITATGTTASAQDHPAGLTPKFYRILVVP